MAVEEDRKLRSGFRQFRRETLINEACVVHADATTRSEVLLTYGNVEPFFHLGRLSCRTNALGSAGHHFYPVLEENESLLAASFKMLSTLSP